MSYYLGEHLDKRVKAYGLENIRQFLVDVAAGRREWVEGVKVIPAKPEAAEQLRITLYSLLHDTGLKPMVQVKLLFGELVLCRKKEPDKAGSHIPAAPLPHVGPAVEDVPEDLTKIFED